MDFIAGLPESKGFNTILVIVDHFSKMIKLVPCKDLCTSPDLVDLLISSVWKHYGLSDSIISDRGPQFVSRFITMLYRKLKIKLKSSTAFHPQTDGQTERVNQFVEMYLQIVCEGNEKTWVDHLPGAQFAYN